MNARASATDIVSIAGSSNSAIAASNVATSGFTPRITPSFVDVPSAPDSANPKYPFATTSSQIAR